MWGLVGKKEFNVRVTQSLSERLARWTQDSRPVKSVSLTSSLRYMWAVYW